VIINEANRPTMFAMPLSKLPCVFLLPHFSETARSALCGSGPARVEKCEPGHIIDRSNRSAVRVGLAGHNSSTRSRLEMQAGPRSRGETRKSCGDKRRSVEGYVGTGGSAESGEVHPL
jgi:hypothetical protein